MKTKLTAGVVLLSNPLHQYKEKFIGDSVILVLEHDDEGTIAFALNKITDLKVSQALPEWPILDLPLSLGGGTETYTIFFLHTCRPIEDSKWIANGVYWGGNVEQMKEYLKEGKIRKEDIYFYAGHYSWEKDKLQEEVDNGTFTVLGQLDREYLQIEPTEMYEELSKKISFNRFILSSVPAICYN